MSEPAGSDVRRNRIAANPIPYWLKGGKTREVFDEAFRDFRDIGFTAVKADVPEGMTPADIVPKMLKRGVIVAAGLHKDIKNSYFRIGSLGITAVDKSRGDIDTILKALREALEEAGYKFPA